MIIDVGKHNLIKSLYGIIKFEWDQGSNFATFWDQGSKFGVKNWDQRWKNIPGYDPDVSEGVKKVSVLKFYQLAMHGHVSF